MKRYPDDYIAVVGDTLPENLPPDPVAWFCNKLPSGYKRQPNIHIINCNLSIRRILDCHHLEKFKVVIRT